MIKGIGIDMVSISEIARYIEHFGDTYINSAFTEREIHFSKLSPNQAEYLSTRFAAKEAVYKAIAHLTKQKDFDFRIVESLNESDGYPVIHINEELRKIMNEAKIRSLLVSMTTEGDFAMAFVTAE